MAYFKGKGTLYRLGEDGKQYEIGTVNDLTLKINLKENMTPEKETIQKGSIADVGMRVMQQAFFAKAKNDAGIPTIICLCGSTRFHKEYVQANYDFTMKGKIVLSVGFFGHAVDAAHGETVGITPAQKGELDELHKRKIDLADEVYVINKDGYIGDSTRSEIIYAAQLHKPISFMEKVSIDEINQMTGEAYIVEGGEKI